MPLRGGTTIATLKMIHSYGYGVVLSIAFCQSCLNISFLSETRREANAERL